MTTLTKVKNLISFLSINFLIIIISHYREGCTQGASLLHHLILLHQATKKSCFTFIIFSLLRGPAPIQNENIFYLFNFSLIGKKKVILRKSGTVLGSLKIDCWIDCPSSNNVCLVYLVFQGQNQQGRYATFLSLKERGGMVFHKPHTSA